MPLVSRNLKLQPLSLPELLAAGIETHAKVGIRALENRISRLPTEVETQRRPIPRRAIIVEPGDVESFRGF